MLEKVVGNSFGMVKNENFAEEVHGGGVSYIYLPIFYHRTKGRVSLLGRIQKVICAYLSDLSSGIEGLCITFFLSSCSIPHQD